MDLELWIYGLIHLLSPNGPNVVYWPQTPRLRYFLKFHNFIGFILWFWKNEVLFVKNGVRALDLWFDTSSEPKWPKCSFQVPDLKFKNFFEISWIYWIHLMNLEKMRSCSWKLELGFWTYGLIHLGPNWPKCSF